MFVPSACAAKFTAARTLLFGVSLSVGDRKALPAGVAVRSGQIGTAKRWRFHHVRIIRPSAVAQEFQRTVSGL